MNTNGWLRNKAGRVWLEALDGPHPDTDPNLDQLIEDSARELGAATPEEQQPAAVPVPAEQPAARPALQIPPRYLVALVVLVPVVLALLFGRTDEQAPASIPTAPPPTLAPTRAPTIAPTQQAELPVPADLRALTWSIAAYDAGGHWIGPLAAGRPIRIIRAVDSTWLEVESESWQGAPASGIVRVYGVDLLVEPPARPTPVPTVPPPPTPIVQPASVPAPTSAPTARPRATTQPIRDDPPGPAPTATATLSFGGRPNGR